MSVYGNREFDDCLVELQDIASDIEELNTFASRIIEMFTEKLSAVATERKQNSLYL